MSALGGMGLSCFDDAYMYLRYARNWLEGGGVSWNVVDGPVHGITSTAYLLLITGILAVTTLPGEVVLTAASFSSALLGCVALVCLGFLVELRHGVARTYWLPLLLLAYLPLMQAFRYHGMTGMDTSLSMLANSLLACSVVLWSRSRRTFFMLLCLLSAYVAFLARPDNGVYALLLAPLFILAMDRSRKTESLLYVFLFLVILALDAGLKYALFGDATPLSSNVKSSGYYVGYLGTWRWNVASEFITFWGAVFPFILCLICFSTKRSASRLIALGIPVIATFGYLFTVTQIMGYKGRFFFPSLPFFVLAAFIALSDATEHGRSDSVMQRSLPWRILVALGCMIVLISEPVRRSVEEIWVHRIAGAPVEYNVETPYEIASTLPLPMLDAWTCIESIAALVEQLPPDLSAAATEHGVVAARRTDITIIDMTGLHDRYLAKNGFSASYLFSRSPDFIWLPHDDYSGMRKKILDNHIFVREYDYYPGAWNYGFAIRRASKEYARICSETQKEFGRIYNGRSMSKYKAKARETGEEN